MAERLFIISDLGDIYEKIAKIQDAKIEVLVCEIEENKSFGIIIKESDFNKVCSICGIKTSHYELVETDKENTFFVRFGLDIDPKDPLADLKEKYARLVIGRLRKDVGEIETKVATSRQKIDKLTTEIHTLSRSLLEEQSKLAHLQEYATEMANRLLVDFETLSKLPEIESIDLKDSLLQVTTKPILVKLEKEEINLGSYRIEISPNYHRPMFYPTSDSQIRRINGENYIHPAVQADNSFHFSKFMPTFAQLMGEWNFSQVILLAIRILKNPEEKAFIARWWSQ